MHILCTGLVGDRGLRLTQVSSRWEGSKSVLYPQLQHLVNGWKIKQGRFELDMKSFLTFPLEKYGPKTNPIPEDVQEWTMAADPTSGDYILNEALS